MSNNLVATTLAPKAIGAYSQGIEVNGTYYFSGTLGINPETLELPTNFMGQLQQILKNIDALIDSQKLKRNNIVKTTIFMTDLKDFALVNKAYEEFFKHCPHFPARSTVQVAALPKNALIEIEVIAVK